MRTSVCLLPLFAAFACTGEPKSDDTVAAEADADTDTDTDTDTDADTDTDTDTDTDADTDADTDTDTDTDADTVELLANPGFEQGETWWNQANGTLNHAWSRTGENIYGSSATFTAHEGVAAYKVWGRYADSVPNDSEHGLNLTELTPGDTLEFSAYMMTHADDQLTSGNHAALFVRFLDDTGATHSEVVGDTRIDSSAIPSTWLSHAVQATVPEGVSSGQVGLRFQLGDWSDGGSVYVDSVSLTTTGTGAVDGERLLVWHDEFDGSTIDTTKWTHELLDPYAYNSELQQYTDSTDNSRVEDGQLIITARGGVATSSTGYTSARLNTEGKAAWTYGRMEGALMMPDGIGTWPALWMLPTDWTYGGWPDSGEIDIMEHVGCDANEIVGTVHTGAYNHMIGTQQGGDLMWPTATSNLHVYAIDWSPEQIHFSLDGLRYFTFENDGVGDPATWPFDQRFHFVVNLAVGGSWGGYCGLDASAFPEEYRVDWIRVYQTEAEATGSETP